MFNKELYSELCKKYDVKEGKKGSGVTVAGKRISMEDIKTIIHSSNPQTNSFDIPKYTSQEISEIVKEYTKFYMRLGFSMDSISVYFHKAIECGLYEANVDIGLD